MRLFTYELTSGSLSIDFYDGVTQISIQGNPSSSATIQGNFTFKGLASTGIELSGGESITIQTPTNSPVDGLTITHVSGSIDILIGI